ncbi:MAG TPA: VOC family protein [Blastocatellia bacterium]
MKNRSVPTDIVLPHLAYNDLPAAIAWLKSVFGFAEHYRYGGPGGDVEGAQMHIGDAWIMVGRAKDRWASPKQTGYNTQSLTIFVDDVDGHFANAKSAGATIVEELHETEYGERQYGVLDLEGHHWLFSRHARDVSPDEWGATIAR